MGIARALDALTAWERTGVSAEGTPVLRAAGRPDVLRARTERLHLHAEPLERALHDAGVRPDLFVFLSKHAAKSGQASLTVHPLGNFTEARYGGLPGRLTPTLGAWQSEALRRLEVARRHAAYPAAATFEVTHHGPLLETPAFFLELGSTEGQWHDEAGHRVLARAAWDLAERAPPDAPVVVGLGGGHYAPRHSEAALTRRVHFAHLVPTHAAQAVAEPERLAEELARASIGAQHYYVHRGTLPGPVEDRWAAALQKAGLKSAESRAWDPWGEDFTRTP